MLMVSNLRLVEPNNIYRKVPTRKPNAEMRTREYPERQLGALANGFHEAVDGVSGKRAAALGLEDKGTPSYT